MHLNKMPFCAIKQSSHPSLHYQEWHNQEWTPSAQHVSGATHHSLECSVQMCPAATTVRFLPPLDSWSNSLFCKSITLLFVLRLPRFFMSKLPCNCLLLLSQAHISDNLRLTETIDLLLISSISNTMPSLRRSPRSKKVVAKWQSYILRHTYITGLREE